MFIVVNYGDKKQALFNPNCKTNLLLENIKDRCQFPREIEIDLSDDVGNLKNLSQTSSQYANEILTTERENLVLIEVRRNGPKSEEPSDGYKRLGVPPPLGMNDITYIPLLNDQNIVTAKFQARLSCKGTPSVTEGKSKKDRRKARRNTEILTASDKNSIDINLASQSLGSGTSPRRNGSSKGVRRGSQPQNRSRSRSKNK